ncbi:MAG: glycosyltransferase family 39 protein [Candidatus Andersenbacteria bacterium]|nr:glycosyltransferase family 39 protein [Candidatus Andersenbacteria bacterium]
MSQITKLFIGGIVILLALLAGAGQVLRVREQSIGHTLYTSNAGELVQGVVVGQTFLADKNNLSAVGVLMANYSNRTNTKAVEFQLREFPQVGRIIRTASVSAGAIGDNQVHRFEFAPIPDSEGRLYIFTLASPQSVPGDAVTVDLDTRDPYHRGAAYVIRNTGGAPVTLELLAAWGKPTIDVAFETYHTVPLREAMVNKVVGTTRHVMATWPQQRGRYDLLGRVAGQSLLILLVVWLLAPLRYEYLSSWGKKRFHFLLLLLFLVGGMLFRLWYATNLPVTYDEGNYLYDALAWRNGVLAGGDGYVKAPLVVAWVAIWQMIWGNSVLAGRLSSVVIGALTIYPLYFLARELWNSRIGLLTAALFSFAGVGVVFDIYVHTQPLPIFFATSGVALLLMALHGTTPRLTFITTKESPSVSGWFFLAGMLLGLGVASRKSVLAIGLLPLLFIGLEGKTWKLRGKHFLMVGAGFLSVLAVFLFFAWYLYGWIGVQEAIGFNSAEDGINAVTAEEAEQVRAYSLRGMTPFFRESLPLIFLFVLGVGLTWETAIRHSLQRLQARLDKSFHFLIGYVAPKLGWIVALPIYFWAWGFFNEYEGKAFRFWAIPELWVVFGAMLVVVLFLPRPGREQSTSKQLTAEEAEKSQQPGRITGLQGTDIAAKRREEVPFWAKFVTSALVCLLWIGGLAFFYMNWIKFHANYIAEFIPPLVLMAAYGLDALFERLRSTLFLAKDYPGLELLRRLGVTAVALVLFWAFFVSNYITFVFEHTGTFDQRAIIEAAAWAKQNIPSTERIFTGAAVIPYVSEHRISLDIAHPRWYAYEFTRTDVNRLNTFLPSAQAMVESFRQARWVLMDEQTKFSFINEYPEIETGLARDFMAAKEFENLSNTLTFYQRVK